MTRTIRAVLLLALASLVLLAPGAAQAADTGFKVKLVRVETPTPASKDALESLGLDLAEGGSQTHRDAVLWTAAEAAALTRAGLSYSAKIADLAAHTRANERRNREFAASVERSAFPSGSEAYRTLDQINEEMTTLAQENPGLVRLITLPEKTVNGRDVLALEIAQDVEAKDGRPVFVNMGVHHAREWPSAEHALEWGYEMINGTKSGDARASRLTKAIRTIVLPVVNPDGYNISRTFGPVDNPDGGAAEVYAYKRKNCNIENQPTEGGTSVEPACIAAPTLGTDPNRNYGGLWGGPGASAVPAEADYRGPGPFSEPETRNIQKLVSSRHVTTLITNHTYTGLVLRPPGIAAQGPSADENRGYKKLGDDMAARNGYESKPSFGLYDTTGTTEDWSYYATGGFGFTFEIGPTEFHPPYEEVVQEWEGTGSLGKEAPVGGGNREAYYVAAESTADTTRHSVVAGKAPAGHVLRLKKEFMTQTSPVEDASGEQGEVLEFKDSLDTTMTVPASGTFEWHVNPSTRPSVAKREGRFPNGPPSDPIELEEAPVTPVTSARIPFTYEKKPGRDDGTMTVEVTNPTPTEDYDIVLYRMLPGGEEMEVGSSAQFVNDREAIDIDNPVPGDYELEVVSFAATGVSYTARVVFKGPLEPREGILEPWTLVCETAAGEVVASRPLIIERNQRVDVDPCQKTAPGGGTTPGQNTPGGGGTTKPPGTTDPSCVAGDDGLRSARVARRGGGLRLDFARRLAANVDVDVFQVSAGRKVIGERRVARFTNRKGSFTWNGRVKGRRAPTGTYFVRYRAAYREGAVRKVDTRRITLRRARGRFTLRPAFYRRESCDTLRAYKLERAVFGGANRRSQGISFRLSAPARAGVEVLRGSRVVKRFPVRQRRAGLTRLRLNPGRLPRGDYRFRLTYTSGGKTSRAILTAAKL